MASGTFLWVGGAMLAAFSKEIDFASDAIHAVMVSSSHTPNQDTDNYMSAIRSNEVTGTNLDADGVLLTGTTMDYDAATNRTRFFADDVSEPDVTASDIQHTYIVDFTPGTDGTRPILGFITWDEALNPSAGTLAITFDGTNGFARITKDA